MQEEFPVTREFLTKVLEEIPVKIPKPFKKIDVVKTPQAQKPVTVLKQPKSRVYLAPRIFGQEKFSISTNIQEPKTTLQKEILKPKEEIKD